MPITTTEAVFLAIDPALHTSGAVILTPDYGNGMLGEEPHEFRGDYYANEFGKVISQSERERYITSLLELADELDLPPVIIAEEWDGPRDRKIRLAGGELGWARDPRWTYTTIMGIGEGWGRWSAEIEAANEFRREDGVPDIILARVLPNDWRDAVFGTHRAKDTESLKATAVRFFEGVFGYSVMDDIAEAGCIGVYALRHPPLGEAVSAWGEQRDALDAAAKAKKRAKKAARKKR